MTQSSRRQFIESAAATAAIIATPTFATPTGATAMYGLIVRIKAVSGQRDALISVLLEGNADMPGCLSYIVARDTADADAIWITEVWDSQASHKASLSLPSVRDAITRAKPLIQGFEQHGETVPVGGHGIAPTA